ncbi:unnamed protein product, partial [Darwinula stevensoni]
MDEDKEQSQANDEKNLIMTYVLNWQKEFTLPYTLTLIDIPGFDDSERIESLDQLRSRIRSIFLNDGNNGVEQVDGICFVVQASKSSLTYNQKNIFRFAYGREEPLGIRAAVSPYFLQMFPDLKDSSPGELRLEDFNEKTTR